MKAVDVRNKIIAGLHQYLQVPVILADQVSPEAELPYVIYSVTSPYIKDNTIGHFGLCRDSTGNVIEMRSEQAGMSLSFTVCSQNRTDDGGAWIQGEDEALNLAEMAQGWFLQTGCRFLSPDVVVESVENVASRSMLMVDEEANRYGFDVAIRYIREDAAGVGEIKMAVAEERMETG